MITKRACIALCVFAIAVFCALAQPSFVNLNDANVEAAPVADPSPLPPSLMENLGRGVVALRTSATQVLVSWRVLGTDPTDIAFNLYRSTNGGPPVALNGAPITGATQFIDATADLTQSNSYFVRPIIFGVEQPPSTGFTVPANSTANAQPFLRVPLQIPAGGTTPDGVSYTYSANDSSVGDLDGDGEYEIIVKWDPSNSQDNSFDGYTGNVYVDAYKLDGTRLWRIDLGRNIRAGAHYTQFIVYDLDGDGKAEIAMKTADATVDGLGVVIGDPNADFRHATGRVLDGPEFLTIFSGETGAALVTTNYIPPRGDLPPWGDPGPPFGNRVDRFLGTVAYLDGQRPSLIMARGYYTRTVLAAWDWRNGTLTSRWVFDTGHTGTPNPWALWRGQGNHNLSVGDVDGDGKDEIMYGAAAVDDDGSGLFSTGLGHGDALHMSDMDPDRPGLEVFQPHESPVAYGPNGLEFRDARTGALIFGVQGGTDIGRGIAVDVDPRFRGYEMWGSGPTGGMYTAQQSVPNPVLGPRGVQISASKPSINHAVWWDGDLLRELLDGTTISKWNWNTGTAPSILSPAGIASNNGSKANPSLTADILGDWREEVIWRESNSSALRIYTTVNPTTHRFYTLMHDRQYRQAIAWQNVGYNQPPHPSFFLGDGMAAPPIPNIVTSLGVLLGPPAPVFTTIETDTGLSATDAVTADNTIVLHGTAVPNTTVNVTRLGSGLIGSVPADVNGNWTFDYTSTPLPQGPTLFTATATDASLNTGASTVPPFTVVVDNNAPAAPVILDIAFDGTLVFIGTSDPASEVTVTLVGTGEIGTAITDGTGKWTFNYSGPALAPGVHTFTAAAEDLAGNVGPDSAPVSIDTSIAAPVITAVSTDTGVSANDGITSDPTLVFTGTGPANHTITVKSIATGNIGTTTSDSSGNWSFDFSATTLTDGDYQFSAAANNGGTSSPSSPAFAVVVDTVIPTTVSINRHDPIVTDTSAANLTFRATFSEEVLGVDAADFTPVFTGTLSGSVSSVVSVTPSLFEVTVGPVTGEGTLRLNLNSSGTNIVDRAGNAIAGGFITGQIYNRILQGNGTWTLPTSGGLWSDQANWISGIIGGAINNTADFSTLEITDDVQVHLDSPRVIGNLVFGDSDVGTSGGWTINNNGNSANTLTLATSAGAPSILVNALGIGSSARISAGVAGIQGLNKVGQGTLILSGANTLNGVLTVNAGTLRVEGGGLTSTTVTMAAGGARLNIAGGTFSATGALTVNAGNGSALIVDAGTANFTSLATNNVAGGLLRINGGVVSATSVNLPRSSDATPSFASGFVVTGGTTTIANTIGLGTNNSWGSMSVEGGSLTVGGIITIGNQASANRGGQMRIMNGTFTSTHTTAGNTPGGIVMAQNRSGNANNVARATFSGGVSTVEKFTLGFDATVNAGSATITLDGGALYIGAGGIVKNGTGAFATNLNFSSGILGARTDWSTLVPINLPTGGNVSVKSADAADIPRNITLAGPISGAGGLTKIGAGRLTLAATNTFSGAVSLNAGVVDVDGSLGPGGVFSINSGGTLTGDGSINRAVTLNSGGTLQPGSSAPDSTLTASSLTWNGNGSLAYTLGATSNHLAISGSLSKGDVGPFNFAFTPAAGLVAGNSYTLATFSSTDFGVEDFSYTGLPAGLAGVFNLTSNSLTFDVFGPPVIITPPQNVVVIMGGSATFTVVVSQTPTLAYQWLKDGLPITGANSPTLTINGVQGADVGSYSVIVSNAAGTVTSDAATLSIAPLALVNHAPIFNNGHLDGSLQQMLGESVTLDGSTAVTGDLFVPGTPTVVLNGSPAYGGTLDGTGSTAPSGYTVTLSSNSALGHVVRRTDPVALPTVNAPLAPAGTRSVTLRNSSQTVGDWTTVRNLTLQSGVGQVAVPGGAYGDFKATGESGFTLGVMGTSEPTVYHFQSLTLNTGAQLQVIGRVIIVLGSGFSVNGGTVGNSANPAWLTLNIHAGNLTINQSAHVYGYVTAPAGIVTINGGCELVGGLASDALAINSNAALRLISPP
jgi:autotransporter-associated beta strand protein